jgi:selenoprotein W-related protein
MKIEIEYCAPCGYLDRAVGLARKLLDAREDDIVVLSLIPGDFGIFDVKVDSSLVFSKEKTGRFPELDDIFAHLPEASERVYEDGAACPIPAREPSAP